MSVVENLKRIGALGVARSICDAYGVVIEEVIGPRRRRYTSAARARRRLVMVIHHSRPDFSYPDIGRLFGLDHTTILYAIRKAEREFAAECHNDSDGEMRMSPAFARFVAGELIDAANRAERKT